MTFSIFIEIQISIKTIPSRGLVKKNQGPRPSPPETKKKQTTCSDKAKTWTSLYDVIFISRHLDNLISS
jgi:hypothetical protein